MSMSDLVLLGIDAVALVACYVSYRGRKYTLDSLSNAPIIDLSTAGRRKLAELPNGCVPYAVVQGTVRAIGRPLRSSHDNRVTGVVKQSAVLEHRWRWSWAVRWWVQESSTVTSSRSSVPFMLESQWQPEVGVELLETAGVEDYDLLTTVSSSFEPRNATIWNSIVSFFLGQQLTGHEFVERMLTDGTRLTGVGTLIVVRTESGRLHLQLHPPTTGPDEAKPLPYLLSRSSIQTLVEKVRKEVVTRRRVLYILAALGAALTAHVVIKRRRLRIQMELAIAEAERMREALAAERLRREQARAEGGGQADDGDVNLCLICFVNQREVLIMDCGHLCCCLGCGQALNPAVCPVCRAPIVRLVPAFIA